MDYTDQIVSYELKKLAKALIKENVKITFYGKAWSKVEANWIYFDTVLDIERIKSEFNFSENIVIHTNTDPKSGTESGFVDKTTGEGLMGRLK